MNGAIAFSLSVAAGLATAIGGLVALFFKRGNKVFLSVCLAFSAGVMLYVSFAELFSLGREYLDSGFGEYAGEWIAAGAFFGGGIIIFAINRLVPSEEKTIKSAYNGDDKKMMRTGLVVAAAIAVHNFPEGLASFVSALAEPSVAAPTLVAIAIHNIPEGIAVAVPVYEATGSKAKAFLWSLFSGLAEPIGALVGWVALAPVMNDVVFGAVFAATAGIMTVISLDELLPTAYSGDGKYVTVALAVGMAVMAASLCLF